MRGRTLLITFVAMVAFAANSLLCRFALREGQIDAATFTAVRLVSGAALLWLVVVLVRIREGERPSEPRLAEGTARRDARLPMGSWLMGLFLFLYAAAFSFAYVGLDAGTGALILFGAVQATMIVYGIVCGERPALMEWVGLVVAVGGLVYLLLPGLSAPPLMSALLMAAAGMAWGFYSLLGRGVPDPALATAGNFVRTVPFAALIGLIGLISPIGQIGAHLTPVGLLLAVVSGAVTSGLGYVAWYAALRDLTATRAAVVQLAVPVIAAVGGVAFIGEELTWSLVVSGVLVLGGIAIAVAGKARR